MNTTNYHGHFNKIKKKNKQTNHGHFNLFPCHFGVHIVVEYVHIYLKSMYILSDT